MVSLLADFWNTVINTCFRNISPELKWTLAIVFLILSFLCLAKVLRVDKEGDKRPIHWGFLVLFLIFFTLFMLYAIL